MGVVPRTAVGIDLGIGDLRKRAVDVLSLPKRRRAVRRRAHQRMAKAHAGIDLEQAGLGGRTGGLGRDSEALGRLPHQHGLAYRIGSRKLQQPPGLGR